MKLPKVAFLRMQHVTEVLFESGHRLVLNVYAKSKVITIKNCMIDMISKQRKKNHIKCSIKTKNVATKWKTKTGINNKDNEEKTITNMENINLTISIITLNIKVKYTK